MTMGAYVWLLSFGLVAYNLIRHGEALKSTSSSLRHHYPVGASGGSSGSEETAKLRAAFYQLLKEKKALAAEVQADHAQLESLQRRIQNPTLGAWLTKRTTRVRRLISALPETDALAHYTKIYMKPSLKASTKQFHALEQGVARVIPNKTSAFIIALMMIFVPSILVLRLTYTLTQKLSLAQYVLLINVFLCGLMISLLISSLVLNIDPLQNLYENAEHVFMVIQCLLTLIYPAFLALLCFTIRKNYKVDNAKAFIFALELMFYVVIGLNYQKRIWKPSMLGQVLHSNLSMYILYLLDFVCMTALTISASRNSERPTFARRKKLMTKSSMLLPTSKRRGTGKHIV